MYIFSTSPHDPLDLLSDDDDDDLLACLDMEVAMPSTSDHVPITSTDQRKRVPFISVSNPKVAS